MKIKSVFFMIIASLSLVIVCGDFSLAKKDINLFEEILRNTNSKTIEYGITSKFTTVEDPESISKYIMDNLSIDESDKKKVVKNGKTYCVDFEKNNMSGYIEIIPYENKNVVTLNVLEVSECNGLGDLKNMLNKCFEQKGINAKYYIYLKAKISDKNIKETNEKVLMALKDICATNVNTLELGNGYSTTAYTGEYESIVTDGKLIDFNFAVCKYSSGNYLIIGTPEILVTY